MNETIEIPESLVPPGHLVIQVTVATEVDIDTATLEAMADMADADGMTAAARAGGPGFVLTGETADASAILTTAWSIIAGTRFARSATLIDLRISTPGVYEAEADRPDTPELLAAPDVAELLGVSRQRVHQLHSEHPRFPAPYVQLGSGPIWTRPAIDHFARSWERKPGRPARKAG